MSGISDIPGGNNQMAADSVPETVPDELLKAFKHTYADAGRRRRNILLLVVLCAMIAVFGIYRHRSKGQAPIRTSLATILPAFMAGAKPVASLDPSWDRYENGGLDYRIRWEEGRRLAAFQVRATGPALTGGLIGELLKELTGVSGYKISSRESRGGFVVEYADAANGSSLILYRDASSGGVRALALAVRVNNRE